MTWVQNSRQLGTRIKRWRTRLGYTTEVAACRSSIPVDFWRLVEEGEASPSAFQLHQMAAAIDADPGQLVQGTGPVGDPVTGATRFRAAAGLAGVAAHDRRILARAAELGRISWFLREALRLPRFDGSQSTPLRGEPWEQGYTLGVAARTALGLGRSPIPAVIPAFASSGIEVVVAKFSESSIEAASVNEPGASPVVIINSTGRRAAARALRSSIAHELCHIMHDANDGNIVTNISRADHREDQIEARANGFAPAFLAPPSAAMRGMAREDLVQHLVAEWWFSVEGACWHTKNILSLSQRAGRELISSMRGAIKFDDDIAEFQLLPTGFRIVRGRLSPTIGTVEDLVQDAIRSDIISAGRAAEIRVPL